MMSNTHLGFTILATLSLLNLSAASVASNAFVSSPYSVPLGDKIGAEISRSEVPFGTQEAYDTTVTFRANVGTVVSKWSPKSQKGAVVFLKPPSDKGWPQRVNSIQVMMDGKMLQPESKLDWLNRPVYLADVSSGSGDFYASIEITQFNRVIKESDRNPNPLILSESDREKYTADYTYVKGIAAGKNKPALQSANLMRRPEESTWAFAKRVMIDAKENGRWTYKLGKATWPASPTDWLNQQNTGNCDDIATYFNWILRENRIPARMQVQMFANDNGPSKGHGLTEFYSSEHKAWIPTDLTALIHHKGKDINECIGRDTAYGANEVTFIGSDDCSYYLLNAGKIGNFGVKYGGVPRFVAPGWKEASVAVGNAPTFSALMRRPIID